jgi:uncharacterized protein YrzB (UPF0473 family)
LIAHDSQDHDIFSTKLIHTKGKWFSKAQCKPLKTHKRSWLMIFKNMTFALFNMSNQVRVILKSTLQNQKFEPNNWMDFEKHESRLSKQMRIFQEHHTNQSSWDKRVIFQKLSKMKIHEPKASEIFFKNIRQNENSWTWWIFTIQDEQGSKWFFKNIMQFQNAWTKQVTF